MHITPNFDKFFKKALNSHSALLAFDPAEFSRRAAKKMLHAFYQPYKWICFVPLFVLSTLISGFLSLVCIWITGPITSSAVFPPIWARFNSWITPMRVRTYGKERIVPGQSYVIVSNHQSHFDIFVIYGWLGMDIKWVMKKELRKAPVIGYVCDKMEHIYIDRASPKDAINSINRARSKLVNGVSVMFFPQGTRSSDGSVSSFKKGAFRLAVDLGLPILPITISGTEKILPKGSLDLFPGKVTMTVHAPISTKNYTHDTIELLINATRRKIISGMPRNQDM